MVSNYSITHYQTSFILESQKKTSSEIAYWIKKKIWNWIFNKETSEWITYGGKTVKHQVKYVGRNEYRIFENVPIVGSSSGWLLYLHGKLKPLRTWGKGFRIQTNICIHDDRVLWGLRYQEEKDDSTVVTEIGITEYRGDNAPNQAAFNIRVSFRPKNAWVTFAPTVPGIIPKLAYDQKFPINICGSNSPFYFLSEPIELASEDDGMALLDYVFSDTRKSPVLIAILNPQQNTAVIEDSLDKFAKRIFGKAHLFILPYLSPTYQAIDKQLKETHSLWHLNIGTLYLLLPKLSGADAIQSEDYPLDWLNSKSQTDDKGKSKGALFQRLLEHIYRQHPVLEDDAVSFTDVQAELDAIVERKKDEAEKARYEAEKAQHEAELARGQADAEEKARLAEKARGNALKKEAEAAKAKEEAAQTKSDAEALCFDYEQIENDRNSLKIQNAKLRTSLDNAEREKEKLQADNLSEILQILKSLAVSKKDLASNIRACEHLFSDCLVIHEKAYKGLAERSNPIDFETAIDCLMALKTRLHPAYVKSQEGTLNARMETAVEGLPIEYSANENKLTMENSKFRALRTVMYEGESYTCEEHLKISKNSCRIYFAYMKKHKKIIVAWMGEHLDTAGTRRKGIN